MSQHRSRPRANALLPPPTIPLETSRKTPEEASEAPDIPPEVLQNIFRPLDMFDLLRCQRVNKTWRSYLPGNDPALRKILFTPSRKALQAQLKATPRITFKVIIAMFAYVINVKDTLKKINMPARVELHPIIEYFSRSMGLVNDEFGYPLRWTDAQRADVEPMLTFRTLEALQDIVCERMYSDGN
jgi:hypothetical protein